jgi:hypothetical protein
LRSVLQGRALHRRTAGTGLTSGPQRSAAHLRHRPNPTASTPTGERLTRWGVHLQADPPHPLNSRDPADAPDPPEPPLRT